MWLDGLVVSGLEKRGEQIVTEVLVVGAGYWGTKCIDTLLQSFPSVVVSSVETDAGSRAKVRSRFPFVPVFESVDEAIADGSIDAALITAPARWHGPLALSLLRAGIHVLVEKPFNLSSEQFNEAQLHQSKGLVIHSGYLYVHNPLVSAIEEVNRSGRFGNLMFIESLREGFGAFRQDVNVVRDLMVHDISIALSLSVNESWTIDSAQERMLLSTGFCAEAEATMTFERGMIAKMAVSQFRPLKNRRSTFFFEEAVIVADEQNELNPFRVFSPPPGLLKTSLSPEWRGGEYVELIELDAVGFDVESPRKTLANSLASFLDSVDRKLPGRTDLRFAREVESVAREIETTLAGGRAS